MNLLFNSDIVNLLLKTNEWTERQEAKIFFFFFVFLFFFVVWKALIVVGWVAGGVEERVLFRAG